MDSYGSVALPKPLASSLLQFFNGFDDSLSTCQFNPTTCMNQSSSPSSTGLHLNTVKRSAFAAQNRHRSAPLNGERSEYDLLDRVSKIKTLFQRESDNNSVYEQRTVCYHILYLS